MELANWILFGIGAIGIALYLGYLLFGPVRPAPEDEHDLFW